MSSEGYDYEYFYIKLCYLPCILNCTECALVVKTSLKYVFKHCTYRLHNIT